MKISDDASNFKASVKSADPDSAKKITDILYQMVEDKKIESFKIRRVTKGANSIDLSPLVPLTDYVDIESLYHQIKDSEIAVLGSGLLALGIAKKILSIVKDGIEIAEKIKGKKSMFGVNCRIDEQSVVKYGRSFGVKPFDTILTSATPKNMEKMFLKERRWGEIKIAFEKYYTIQYIAMFVKHPVAAITHMGEVDHIEYNPETGKSTLILKGSPKKLKKEIPYDPKWEHHNAHGTVYTTKSRIDTADTLADVYPSLDYRRKRKIH
ncbi:hypothetical protein [Nitrosopumilus piranensis]|uniref:Uncharacterized protein n=1 Tax=Nitrosopumilus piranensis TaxID=1582439 RepID=A0A0C5C149_9ARCH|nr:hypothetical protein [Nitrosopumilus piranensis]AJM93040.1 hypothetical protein NPIRD3C_1830 [Nitrosopumilus piranensis]